MSLTVDDLLKQPRAVEAAMIKLADHYNCRDFNLFEHSNPAREEARRRWSWDVKWSEIPYNGSESWRPASNIPYVVRNGARARFEYDGSLWMITGEFPPPPPPSFARRVALLLRLGGRSD